MLVLVTGGHGFVGSHLVRRLLAAGDRVRCLVRREGVPAALEGLPVELVVGDVTRPQTLSRALSGVEEVHHLAARLSALSEPEMLRTNAGGTRHLVEASLAAGTVRRFVHCSSLAVAGPSPDGRPLEEGEDGRPVTWYGRSKALAERIVAAHGAAGLSYVIVRPPVVYGPRDQGLLPVFRTVARGVRPLLGTQPKRYSWIFAEDLADALVVLGRHEATRGGTFYAAHPEVVGMPEFLALVARGAGRATRALAVPDSFLRLLAGAADLGAQATGAPGLLTRDKLHELLAPAWVCSPAAAERVAGWRAKTPLHVGVEATVRWYREHGWIAGRAAVR